MVEIAAIHGGSFPHSEEAEAGVLGGILIDNSAISIVVGQIRDPSEFWVEEHRIVYSAILRLADKHHPIDMITLSECLKDRGELEAVGGQTFLSSLIDATPTTASILYHARIVHERAVARRMMSLARSMAIGDHEDVGDLLSASESAIADVSRLYRYGQDHRCDTISAPDLVDMVFPPRAPILGRWLFPGDRMLLHGARGSGKSHLAMAIGLAIAAGTDGPGLLGWKAERPLRVAYLDYELGAQRIQQILLHAVYSTSPPTPALDRLVICPSLTRMRDRSDLRAADAMIESIGAELVILDSQTFAFGHSAESSAEEWAPYGDWINSLSARGITYIGLGHEGWGGGHSRGTSAKEDSLDLVLGLDRKGRDGCGIDVVLRWTKTRGLDPGDVPRLRVMMGASGDQCEGYPVWRWEEHVPSGSEQLDSRAEEIRRLSASGMQQIEIADRLGISRHAVRRALSRSKGSTDGL